MSARAEWERLAGTWDLVVLGGGATGAAVLREAARCGVRAVLLEQGDFASGTSSRSTKLAHGGLRYLDTGDLGLVLESIRERDRWVHESDGLATALPFVMTSRRSDGRSHWKSVVGVRLYSMLARRWPGPALSTAQAMAALPGLEPATDTAFLPYEEACLDDARLVLRLLQEGIAAGATALNQVRVERLRGSAPGLQLDLVDRLGGGTRTIHAVAAVNATGVWAPEVCPSPDLSVRPLRGSHLLFSRSRWPLTRAVSFRHPRDRRWLCALPWEDVVVFGTTDLDHQDELALEPRVSPAERAYLLEAAVGTFPGLRLTGQDIVSSFAGVRAVVGGRPGAPSAASRRHVVREHDGVVTVTGGKLTTCRQMAHDALAVLRDRLPMVSSLQSPAPFFDGSNAVAPAGVPPAVWSRWRGRFGRLAGEVAACAREGECATVEGTQTAWAELRWALRHEQVHHLEDLLLRRVRVGLFLPDGAEAALSRVKLMCEEELGWSEAHWLDEVTAYRDLWRRQYSPTAGPAPSPSPSGS